LVKEKPLILFQGDSITDGGRNRKRSSDLGRGYPYFVKNLLKDKNIEAEVLNRGISGNRAVDLLGRWDEECLKLSPDIVSILIGVNDTWRRYDANDPTEPEVFEERLEKIINLTLQNTEVKLVLLNPFLLDINEKITRMREDLSQKQEVVKNLAEKYDAAFIDLDKAFAEACKTKAPDHYAYDGVHPTEVGHELIAKLWVDKVFGKR